MQTLEHRLSHVKQHINDTAIKNGRHPEDIQLLAVSKTQDATQLRAAFNLGQTAFGENYVQEAREKQRALSDLAIEWHFIGPLQSNKTREISENFDWVHSVDRLKIAERLSRQRPSQLPPLNICIQVNIDDEATKSGVTLDELPELAKQISQLPGVRIRGLMAIPAPSIDYNEQLASFQALTETLHSFSDMDTLSMGMSGDLEAAIAAGSTIVRIGTAIFGKRQVK